MKYPMTAVIFAGGKSTRMGSDKALLPFGKHNSLAQYQYERLEALFEKTYLSAKENKFDFDPCLIIDKEKTFSPLVSLVTIFETLRVDKIFVLSVDAPFVDESVMAALIEAGGHFDIVAAQSKQGTQPLCAVYHKSIFPLAKKHLKDENHKLNNLLEKSNTHLVYFEDESLFMNLNEISQYNKALSILSTLQ